MPPVEHFKSEEKYRKYRAYVHLHDISTHAKKVCVKGKCHTVKHRKNKRKRTAAKR